MYPNLRNSTATFFMRLSLGLIIGNSLLLMGTPTAMAQVDRAELEGTVTDTSGSVIGGAHVNVVAVETDASPNTGTGLPRQIQFMVRFKF